MFKKGYATLDGIGVKFVLWTIFTFGKWGIVIAKLAEPTQAEVRAILSGEG